MRRSPTRPARAIALPRPQVAVTTEWLVAAIAVVVILGALLAS